MGMYILDAMLAGVRLKALQRMWKTYKLNVNADFVLTEIGFGKCYEDKLIGIDFMKSLGCIVKDADGNVDRAWSEDEIKVLIWNAKETSIDSSAIYNNENLLL